MKKKFVIDCRRMLSGKQLDVDYFAIGLGKEKWNILSQEEQDSSEVIL